MKRHPATLPAWSTHSLESLARLLTRGVFGKRLVLMVGAPGAGKSRIASAIARRGFELLNRDDIREELFGAPDAKGDAAKVTEVFYNRMRYHFSRGVDVVVDNTNFDRIQRLPVLELACEAGFTDIRLAVVDTPLAECLRRNAERDRHVEEGTIKEMFEILHGNNMPGRDEGKRIYIRPARINKRHGKRRGNSPQYLVHVSAI